MALCRGARHAGEESAGSAGSHTAYRIGACAVDWSGSWPAVAGPGQFAREGFTLRRGSHLVRVRPLPTPTLSTSGVGGYARQLSRSHRVVISDGHRTWCGTDVSPDLARQGSQKPAGPCHAL